MNELLMILVMAVSCVLFSLGGTGWKWMRRYLLPCFLLIIALLSHVVWWKAMCMALSLIVALCQGYGESSNIWKKLVTFISYGTCFLFIGWSWWIVITPCICALLFFLSNWKPTEKIFFWKFCEFTYGLLIGVTFISVIK